jgi:uncharacterized protein
VTVVIDTNVLMSAALKNRTPELMLRWIVAQPGWDWVVSTEILAEYKTVLACQKFGFSPDLLQQWLTWLETVTILVDVPGGELPADSPGDCHRPRFVLDSEDHGA